MGRPWHPSLADQLEDVADKLLEAAYAVTAIAGQLREKPTKEGKMAVQFRKTIRMARSERLNLGKLVESSFLRN